MTNRIALVFIAVIFILSVFPLSGCKSDEEKLAEQLEKLAQEDTTAEYQDFAGEYIVLPSVPETAAKSVEVEFQVEKGMLDLGQLKLNLAVRNISRDYKITSASVEVALVNKDNEEVYHEGAGLIGSMSGPIMPGESQSLRYIWIDLTKPEMKNAVGFQVILSKAVVEKMPENPSLASAPPQTERIVFERNEKIYVIDADGSNETSLGLFGRSPTWSPDGTKIAFHDVLGDIYLVNADGSDKTKLTKGHSPAWSPDGKTIAFEWDWRIRTVSTDGTGMVTLGEGRDPAWSPDGTKIAFESHGEIYLMNADGSDKTNLAKGQTPAWSPDGKKLVFEGWSDIYMINADGTEEIKLVPGPGVRGEDCAPAWSPDGKKIIFYQTDGLYVVNSDGSGRFKLTVGNHPSWWAPHQSVAPNSSSTTPTVTKADLVDELKELKDAMLNKIDSDIEVTSIAFTDVKNYWQFKRWADIFSAPLTVLQGTLSLLTKATSLHNVNGDVQAALDGSEGVYQILGTIMMVQGIHEAGEIICNLGWAKLLFPY